MLGCTYCAAALTVVQDPALMARVRKQNALVFERDARADSTATPTFDAADTTAVRDLRLRLQSDGRSLWR